MTRLLCSCRDVVAAFNFNGVQIWRVGSDRMILEFDEKNVPWAPSAVAWNGETHLHKGVFPWAVDPGRSGSLVGESSLLINTHREHCMKVRYPTVFGTLITRLLS